MAFENYAALQADIASWVERADLTAQIPKFIALAEAKMNRTLRVSGATGHSTATITTEYAALPADFAEAIGVSILASGTTTAVALEPWSAWRMVEASALTGTPRFYAIVGSQLRFYPAPTASFTLDMTYYAKAPALSATNASNWILAGHPDVYLYGALMHAAPYMLDDDRLKYWPTFYGAAVKEMLAEDRSPSGKLRVDSAINVRSRGAGFNINLGL